MAHSKHAVAIGRAGRAAITEAGLSLAEYADKAETSLSSLSRRVNGSIPFTYPELVTLSSITGVSLAELMRAAERVTERGAA